MRISLDRKLEWRLSEIFGKRKKREREEKKRNCRQNEHQKLGGECTGAVLTKVNQEKSKSARHRDTQTFCFLLTQFDPLNMIKATSNF